MSGGKGGSTTSSVEIPEYIEEAARRNLAKAEDISQIGYVPYYGPDVAAFTPFQEAGFQQTADVASAFGMGPQMSQTDIMGGMPAPTEFAGGVRGYSSAPLYQQAVDELAAQRPAQAQFIESFFIDPVTGQVGSRVPTTPPVAPVAPVDSGGGGGGGGGGGVAPIVAPVSPVTPYTPADPALAIQPDETIFSATPPEVQVAQEILATDPLNPQYNDAFEAVYDYQAEQAAQDPTGQSTGFGITPEIIDAVGVDAFLPPTIARTATIAIQPDPEIFSATPPEVQAAQELLATDPLNPQYNDAFEAVYDYQAEQAAQDPTGQSTGFGITPEIIDAVGVDAFLPPQAITPDPQLAGEAPAFVQAGQQQLATLPSDPNYNPVFQEVYDYQSDRAQRDPRGQMTGVGITPDIIDAAGVDAFLPPEAGGGLLSNIGEFIASGGVTGAALRGVGGLLEPALGAAESGIASMIGDPRTFAQRDADRLEAERLRAIDRSQEESAAVQAQREAARTEQEKLKVSDPEAFVAQFDKEGKADAKKAVKTAQKLAVAPRPPKLTGGKARDWIKANVGVSVDKKDATDYIRSLQQDWDRQNG